MSDSARMNSRIADMLPRLWPLAVLIVVVAVIALAASFAPAVLQRRATQGLIDLIAVVGLYVFAGNSGVLSFGNVAFMAVGAYVSALLTMKPGPKSVFLPDLPAIIAHAEWPNFAGALAGGVAAAMIALVVGWPLMRLTGVSASIATFAILVVANVVFGNWTSVTGGQNSLMGLPAYVDLWTAFAWAIATMVIAFAYQETRSALLLRASREDEAAAQAAGRQRGSSPPYRLRHFSFSFRYFGRFACTFSRHRAGREFLPRPNLPDRGYADHRRPGQPDRCGRWRRRRSRRSPNCCARAKSAFRSGQRPSLRPPASATSFSHSSCC